MKRNQASRGETVIAVTACVLICGASLAKAQEPLRSALKTATPASVGMSSDKLAKVDEAMAELLKQDKLAGGIVMIAKNKKIVHFQAYGKRDLGNDLPMEKDTIVRIYSMSKAITTAAALMLVEEGKLKLDEPVSTYVPELRDWQVASADGDSTPAQKSPTVRDLMRHTAGLSYGGSGVAAHDAAFKRLQVLDRATALEAMTKKLPDLPLSFAPGTDWQYGISTDVLGRIVEIGAGKPLDEVLKLRIFQPLGMQDTGFFVPAEKIGRFAVNYRLANGKLSIKDGVATSRYRKKPALLSGGGGLVSTASDYMRFLLMIAADGKWQGKQLLEPETVRLMTTNQVPKEVGWIKFGSQVREGVGFGLGFSVRDKMSDWDPQGRVGEYGWGGAASTHYWASPKDDLIVVTLEQVMPYSFSTEFKIKGLIYDAIVK